MNFEHIQTNPACWETLQTVYSFPTHQNGPLINGVYPNMPLLKDESFQKDSQNKVKEIIRKFMAGESFWAPTFQPPKRGRPMKRFNYKVSELKAIYVSAPLS